MNSSLDGPWLDGCRVWHCDSCGHDWIAWISGFCPHCRSLFLDWDNLDDDVFMTDEVKA